MHWVNSLTLIMDCVQSPSHFYRNTVYYFPTTYNLKIFQGPVKYSQCRLHLRCPKVRHAGRRQ